MESKEKNADGFTFFKSFTDCSKFLSDAERAMYYDALINYGLFGTEPPSNLPDNIKMLFILIKPIIDTSQKRREGARLRWKKEQEEKNASIT